MLPGASQKVLGPRLKGREVTESGVKNRGCNPPPRKSHPALKLGLQQRTSASEVEENQRLDGESGPFCNCRACGLIKAPHSDA